METIEENQIDEIATQVAAEFLVRQLSAALSLR